MPQDVFTISVIICAYTLDRWPDLLRAVSSVQRQTIPANEIILVIDHNPILFERSRKIFPEIRVVENREDQGLSGARNTGISYARGQIIAFMDEDAMATSNWIENLIAGYTDENILGVGGEVRPLWTINPPGWFPEEFQWVVGCSYKGLPDVAAAVRNPIGCNMSFRKEPLHMVGGFRNGIGRIGTLPVGCEETELSIRMRQIYPRKVVLYQPTAVVYHRVPAWRTRWSYFVNRCFSEGISKALVTQFVGANDGLASERRYITTTLPKAVIQGVHNTIVHRNADGLRRAGTIIAGLVFTSAGYLFGIGRKNLTSRSSKSGHLKINNPAHEIPGARVISSTKQ